jgi:adenine phosphoribosyltransferase
MDLKAFIRDVPDFPKPGILFRDINPLLANPGAWRFAMERMADAVRPMKPELLAGIESRGFLMAAPLALHMGLGFMMVRKKSKLPGATIAYTYDLEYGSDTLEIQADAVKTGQRVAVLDDVLATGGTMAAAMALIGKAGGTVVGGACLIELKALDGRHKLNGPFHTLIQY